MKKLITILFLCFQISIVFASKRNKENIQLTSQNYCLLLPEGRVCFKVDENNLLINYPSNYSKQQVQEDLNAYTFFEPIEDSNFINYPKAVEVKLKPGQKNSIDFIKKFNKTKKFYQASPILWSNHMKHALYDLLFVKLKNNNLKALADYGKRFNFTFEESKMKNIYKCKLNSRSHNTFEVAKYLQEKNVFEFAEPDWIYFGQTLTNDTYFTDQWSLQNTGQFPGIPGADMDIVNAWALSTGSSSVSVGILDCFGSVSNFTHSDISFASTYDATGTGFFSTGFAGDAHGINCAGIIASNTNNNNGIAGIAYNSQVKAIKIATINNSSGNWTSTGNSVSDGIIWGYQNCSVLSNSNTFGSSSSLVDNAIANSITLGRGGLGTPFLSSNGNGNTTTIKYPASNPNSIAVAASSMCDERKSPSSCDAYSWGSDYGIGTDVAAPGVSIQSTDIAGFDGYTTGDYCSFSGTSAACPAAAAVMALIIAYQPSITYTNARYALESTCEKVGGYSYSNTSGQPNGTWSNDLGYGRINAFDALQSLNTSGTCSGTTILNSCSGSFTDGSGASNYGNNLSCAWLIQVPTASSISLSFTNLNTETGVDIVYIYDGTSNSAPLLGQYSGSTIPLGVTSSSGNVYIEFITDGTVTSSGWGITYSCNSSSAGCSGTTFLNACSGNFSDGSGLNNYSNNLNCSWLIQVPTASSITLNFTSMNTESGYDYVYIYDGNSSAASILGIYSGSSIPPSITSSTGNVYIEFVTDGTVTYGGWDIYYTCNTTTIGCSGTTVLTACSGNFSDGSGIANYANNLNCAWLIQVPSASSITLNFTSFDIESNYDYVYIYDGSSSAATLIGSFTGSTLPPSVASSSGNVYIEFVTDGTVTYGGWDISYICCGSFVANAGPDINLNCNTTSGIIGSTAVSGYSYSWLPITGLSSPNIAQPTASPLFTTTYTLTVNNGSGCIQTDVVTVNVNNNSPIANAGIDKYIGCTSTSAMIGTTAIAGNSYSWSPTIGLSSSNIAQPIASPTITTTYFVTVTNASGCTASDAVIVNVNTSIPTANAGPDKNHNCTTTSSVIGTAAVAGYSYSWSPASGLSSSNIAQPIASPTSTTTYIVTVTNASGCTSSDAVIVNVNTSIPTANAGPDKNLNCTTTSSVIGTAAIAGYSYSWSPVSGLSSTSIAQPIASPTSTTTYVVTVTNASGCTSNDAVIVNVNTSIPTANAGPDKNLNCTTTSSVIGTAAIAGYSYSWSPVSGLSSTSIAQPIASPTSTTTYVVTVTNASGCTSNDVIIVNVNMTSPTANAGPDQIVTLSNPFANIGAPSLAGYSYSWLPTSNLNSSNISDPIANPPVTTTYTLTVIDTNGCIGIDMVNVIVQTPTGNINLNQDETNPSVYPNPIKHTLYIDNLKETMNYSVLNLTGEIVLKGIVDKHANNIPFSSFAKGNYVLKLSTKNETFIYKVLKD